MKKEYINPSIEIQNISNWDVILTSTTFNNINPEDANATDAFGDIWNK